MQRCKRISQHNKRLNLKSLAKNMSGTSICALCDGAAMPLGSLVEEFWEEFEYFVKNKRSYVLDRKQTALTA